MRFSNISGVAGRYRPRGLTLIELLVVLVILAALNDASGASKFGDYDYVAVGLGGPVSLKGATMMEIPLAVTANLDPTRHYCRVICVFKVPNSGATTSFPAQYVGCFFPDATSQRDSVDSYYQGQAN